MKKFLLLTNFILLFLSCSDQLEFSTTSIQGEKDTVLFRTTITDAIANEDGSVRIVAQLPDETITLNIASTSPGTYVLNASSSSSAVIENDNNLIYTTANNGDGEIVIETFDLEAQTFTGSFRFNAVSSDGDIINYNRGVFYGVPLLTVDGIAASQLNAFVDASQMDIDEVSTEADNGIVEITAMATDGSFITLIIPETTAIGSYNLNQQSTYGTYAVYGFSNGTTSNSQNGTLLILEHDIALNRIRGTFIFNTLSPNSVEVNNGNFTAFY